MRQGQFLVANNRIPSLGVACLLVLAAISGVYYLLPLQSARAETATVSFFLVGNCCNNPATLGIVREPLIIRGTGFTGDAPIAITTLVGQTTVPWLTHGVCGAANGGMSSTTPPVDSLVSTSGNTNGCLITDAEGDFVVEVEIPALPYGGQPVAVTDGVNTATAFFTIEPSMSINFGTSTNYGFPEEAIAPTISVSGFGAGESVTISTPMWTTRSYTMATGATGSGTTGQVSTAVADTSGGQQAVTATGATSGQEAITYYTVHPWAAFYDSVAGPTTFSFIGTAPTALLVEAHGLPAGTISANSTTIGGVSTVHAAVKVGTNGAFMGLVVAPTGSVPFGPVSVVIDGTNFDYAAGNIAMAADTWGGALISSTVGTTSSTGVVSTDESSYKPGTGFTQDTTSPAPAQNQIGLFGYGFVPAHSITLTPSTGLGVTSCAACVTVSGGGAFFLKTSLGDTAYSTAATPTTPESYTLFAAENAVAPANILDPSIAITPWVQSLTVSPVDFSTTNEQVTVHGLSDAETATLTIGDTAMVTGGTCTTSSTGTCTTVAGQVPDLAERVQEVTVSGSLSGQTATQGVVYYFAKASSNGGETVQPDTGSSGTTVQIRTGSTYGIHGLLPNTPYNVVWNAIGSSVVVGSFISTSTGGIPGPGVQFVTPGDASGIHIIDIQNSSGVSNLFGSGTIAGDVSQTIADYNTAYGDTLFNTIDSVAATTTVVSCSPATVAIDSISTCRATVTGSSPTGPVTWTTTETGQFSSGGTCTLNAGSCSVDYSGTVSGTSLITATYRGDSSNSFSSGSFELTVRDRSTSASVSCAKPYHKGVLVTCTATVIDSSPGTPITPSGEVTFSVSLGQHSGSCTLSGGGATAACAFTFTPSKIGVYKIMTNYTGDASHLGSSASRSVRVT